MTDGCGLLLIVGVVAVGIVIAALAHPSTAPAPASSAPTAEYWHPCEPPRSDVECWRSGHAVVCLPLTPKENP